MNMLMYFGFCNLGVIQHAGVTGVQALDVWLGQAAKRMCTCMLLTSPRSSALCRWGALWAAHIACVQLPVLRSCTMAPF